MASQEKVHRIDEDRLSMISRMSQAVVDIPKANLTVVKAFHNPPQAVKEVLEASLTVLGENNTDWKNIRAVLGNPKFQKRIKDLDPESVPDARRQRARQILGNTSRDIVHKCACAMVPIYEWCEAVVED